MISYSLFSPEHLAICILSKGEIDAANLYESWFTYRDDDRGDSEEQRNRR